MSIWRRNDWILLYKNVVNCKNVPICEGCLTYDAISDKQFIMFHDLDLHSHNAQCIYKSTFCTKDISMHNVLDYTTKLLFHQSATGHCDYTVAGHCPLDSDGVFTVDNCQQHNDYTTYQLCSHHAAGR